MSTFVFIVLALGLASVVVLTLLLLWLAAVPPWLFNKTEDAWRWLKGKVRRRKGGRR
jgi:hypothetical protein